MGSEYSRMRNLLEGIGLSFNDGGITNAEIYAYSKGIELVRSVIQNCADEIFFTFSQNPQLSKYADMIDVDMLRYSTEELKELIIERLSKGFGHFSRSEYENAFNKIGSGSFDSQKRVTTFSNVNSEDLKELGKFIEAYNFIKCTVLYDANGMTFDMWDDWGQTFNTYDSLRLPFSILDKLRRE